MLRLLCVLMIILLFSKARAQDVASQINLQSSYLVEIPTGDLSERYGINSKFEIKVEYLRNNWAYYVKGGLRVGDNVKQDVLAPLRTSEGFVIGVNGFYADLFGRKRGFDFGLGIDRLIRIPEHSRHFFRLGLGVVKGHHWIRIADESQSVPQILGDFSQVYDRFSSGYGLEENIQFQYNSIRNNAAFLIGFQFQQLFAKEHRFKLIRDAKSARRQDNYFGVKLTYLLPLYKFSTDEAIYY